MPDREIKNAYYPDPDPNTALDLIDEIEEEMASFTATGAYDTIAIYETAAARRSTVSELRPFAQRACSSEEGWPDHQNRVHGRPRRDR